MNAAYRILVYALSGALICGCLALAIQVYHIAFRESWLAQTRLQFWPLGAFEECHLMIVSFGLFWGAAVGAYVAIESLVPESSANTSLRWECQAWSHLVGFISWVLLILGRLVLDFQRVRTGWRDDGPPMMWDHFRNVTFLGFAALGCAVAKQAFVRVLFFSLVLWFLYLSGSFFLPR